MGFFRPDMCDQALLALEMMQFDGIEGVRQKIAEGGTLFKKMQQLTPLVMMLAQQLDQMQGSQYTPQVAQILGVPVTGGMGMVGGMPGGLNGQPEGLNGKPGGLNGRPAGLGGEELQTNPLGAVMNSTRRSQAGESRKAAARRSTPR